MHCPVRTPPRLRTIVRTCTACPHAKHVARHRLTSALACFVHGLGWGVDCADTFIVYEQPGFINVSSTLLAKIAANPLFARASWGYQKFVSDNKLVQVATLANSGYVRHRGKRPAIVRALRDHGPPSVCAG